MNQPTDQKPKTKRYYTVKEVAARHNTCERSVRRIIKTRELIAHRFGRSIRIGEDDLLNYERLRRAD